MFNYNLKIKTKDNKIIERRFEDIIWYQEPIMFIDEFGEYLLSMYNTEEEEEIWFIINDSNKIKEFINNNLTLKELLNSDASLYSYYDYENDLFEIKGFIYDIKEDIIFPKDNSYLGNLYTKKEELLDKIKFNYLFKNIDYTKILKELLKNNNYNLKYTKSIKIDFNDENKLIIKGLAA